MTVTAPLGTNEGANRQAQRIEVVDQTTHRDPALLFVLVGTITLIAIIVLAYVLTSAA